MNVFEALYASSKKVLKTDEDLQKELLKKKQIEENNTRQEILAEYEQRRTTKIKRYAQCLPFYNLDIDFVADHLLHYPLLARESLNESGSEFEKQAALNMYSKREQDSLKKHILFSKTPERTSLKLDVKTPSVSNIIEIAQPLPTALFEWQMQKIRVLGKDGFYKYKKDNLRTGTGISMK